MIKVRDGVEDLVLFHADDSFDCRMAVQILETTLSKMYPNKAIWTEDLRNKSVNIKLDDKQVFVVGETETEYPENFLVFTQGVKAERDFSLKPNYRSSVKKFGVDYGYTHKVIDEILNLEENDLNCSELFGESEVHNDCAPSAEGSSYGYTSSTTLDEVSSYNHTSSRKHLEDWTVKKLCQLRKISASEYMDLLEELVETSSLSFALDKIKDVLSCKDKTLMDEEMVKHLREHREIKFNVLRNLIGSSFVDEFDVNGVKYKFLCMNSSKFDKDILKIVEQEIFRMSEENIKNFEESHPLYGVKDIDSFLLVDRAEYKHSVLTRLKKSNEEIINLYQRGVLSLPHSL